jgi:hypothetical protein
MRWLGVGVVVLMLFVGAGYASAVDEMEALDAEMLQPGASEAPQANACLSAAMSAGCAKS